MRVLGLIPLLFSLAMPVMALEAPQGPVILKVTGNVLPAEATEGWSPSISPCSRPCRSMR